ncbi:hypothetical protein [Streptomonospora arabica]|uniref:ACT domain-containing protein n=1 Tax=Streptomonospora arabica TaxID=412417 RepID=A0ABV9SPQ6_9ACTN
MTAGAAAQEGFEVAGTVTGVTHRTDMARVLVRGVIPEADPVTGVLTLLAESGAGVDLVARTGPAEDETRVGLALPCADLDRVRPALAGLARDPRLAVEVHEDVGEVAVEGMGLLNRPHVTAGLLCALAGVPQYWLAISQTRTSAVVPRTEVGPALSRLREALPTLTDPNQTRSTTDVR